MINKIKRFFDAIRAIKTQTGTYRKITIDELTSDFIDKNLDYIDLSELDLSDYGDLFMSHPTGPFSHTGIHGWTENVIWPSPEKMPTGFNPHKILEQHKHPKEIDSLHKDDVNGDGINIAIIDNVFNPNHPEYENNIKYVQGPLFKMKNNSPHYHGSMVVGCAIGKTTGVATKASVYYFTKAKTNHEAGQETITVLKSVLKFNKKQPLKNKIHILSCSWSPKRVAKNNGTEYQEIMKLFNELESNNIKIIFCGGNKEEPEYKSSFSISKTDFIPTSENTISNEYEHTVQIPTNEKTVPYCSGGYLYQKLGGDSSAAPYLAGVYACALQNNQIFMTRPNWQEELDTILQETATPTKNGGKMINPVGIREHVSEISHEMETNLIKKNGIQHE